MPEKQTELTRDEMRAILKRQCAAYEQMEIDRLRTPWREPTLEEKLSFDRLMADVNRRRGPSRPCGMVDWYRALMRTTG